MLVTAAFILAVLATLALRPLRTDFFSRSPQDWGIDITGLWMQGTLVPLVQSTIVTTPGPLVMPAWGAFLLNFVVIDYLYYWNHRLLHTSKLWPVHFIHHASTHFDVFSTARNALITPFFICYIWLNTGLTYILADPAPFLLAAALTAALDMWRHSTFAPPHGSKLHRFLAFFLITPHEHGVHHQFLPEGAPARNFGANLSIWDKWHGTYWFAQRAPLSYGAKGHISLKSFLFPFGQQATRS